MIGHRAETGLVLVLLGLASCGRFGFAPRSGGPDAAPDDLLIDADRDSASPATRQCIPLTGGWTLEAPVRIPGINAPELDGEATLSPDGLTLYFASDRGTAGWDSYRASRSSLTGDFGKPVPQAEINTESTTTAFTRSMFSPVQGVNTAANEYDPWVSPDGLRLYFFRSDASADDLWLAERASTTGSFSTVAPRWSTAPRTRARPGSTRRPASSSSARGGGARWTSTARASSPTELAARGPGSRRALASPVRRRHGNRASRRQRPASQRTLPKLVHFAISSCLQSTRARASSTSCSRFAVTA